MTIAYKPSPMSDDWNSPTFLSSKSSSFAHSLIMVSKADLNHVRCVPPSGVVILLTKERILELLLSVYENTISAHSSG